MLQTAGAAAISRAAHARDRRPNLLFLIADDHAGYVLGAAALRVPVVLDGVIAGAAALAAVAFCPDAAGYLIAGHRSTEPGASRALAALGLRPVLDLDLRLGEGSGAVLALPVIQAAARVLRDVATFDSAGVSGAKE